MFIYIVLYTIDSLNSSSFTVLNMKKTESVSLSVRITTCFSVIKQLSSVVLANDKIFLLVGKISFKVIVWFTYNSSGLFWLS